MTSHPAALAQQVRWGPRNRMQRATRLKRKRKFGFLARLKSKTGRKILLRRRLKGRLRLATS
jgi:large subunit ribosomal protein L34